LILARAESVEGGGAPADSARPVAEAGATPPAGAGARGARRSRTDGRRALIVVLLLGLLGLLLGLAWRLSARRAIGV